MTKEVVVIGAGASGLMAAESAASAGARVILLEKMDIPGAKLRLTGNGRCNLANQCDIAEFVRRVVPRGRFVRSALARFSVDDIRLFLGERGVPTYADTQGRVYPKSDRAVDVVDCLVRACETAGAEILCRSAVEGIIVENGCAVGVRLCSADIVPADAVVLCAGGSTYPHTGSSGDGYAWAVGVGHQVSRPKPGLVGLLCSEPWIASLQGISLKDVSIVLYADKQKLGSNRGGVMFAHDGISGPAVLSLSLYTAERMQPDSNLSLVLDLVPLLDEQQLDAELLRLSRTRRCRSVMDLLRGFVPARVAVVLADQAGVSIDQPVAQLSARSRYAVLQKLKHMSARIDGPRSLERGMVTVGGVSTKELNPRTMQSSIVQGLYMAGEVIDIAGDSGGFNLQMAFATGRLAGENAAREEPR